MIKQSKMSPEVLMYLQNIKKYFQTNETAKRYFSVEGNEERFYEQITEISQKNFEDNGEPELSLEQFEELREKLSEETKKEKEKFIGVFLSLGELGFISLN